MPSRSHAFIHAHLRAHTHTLDHVHNYECSEIHAHIRLHIDSLEYNYAIAVLTNFTGENCSFISFLIKS